MSSVSGSSAAYGLPVADSDVTLPYESSASASPPKKRDVSRVKPGAKRRSKSAPRVSVSRRVKSASASRDAGVNVSPSPRRAVAERSGDVLRLESTVRQMSEAWQDLNVRAAQEMSEQQWRIESARHELDQARQDAMGVAASAQSAVGQARAEAVESLRNVEVAANQKYALSEEGIAKRHSDELRRVEVEHQRRLREALHGMEHERVQLKQSAEMVHANVVQATNVAQETRLMEQRMAAEAALAEQKRMSELEREKERHEWNREIMRRDLETAALQQQLMQMKTMMDDMRGLIAAGAPPPPPPPPVVSSGLVDAMPMGDGAVRPYPGATAIAAGAPPPPPPPVVSSGIVDAMPMGGSGIRPCCGPPPGIVVPRRHDGDPGGGDGNSSMHLMDGMDGDSEESDDPDSSGSEGGRRRKKKFLGGKREAASITLNPLPAGAAGFRRWKTDALRDMAGAAERPRRAFKWLLQVTDVGISDRSLNRPGRRYESLDGKILTALGKVVASHAFLQRKLHSYYESSDELTSGRVTLRRIFEHYSTDADMNSIFSVSDFMQCTLGNPNSEEGLERFYEMWVWIETGLSEPVAENIRESLLWTQLKGCSLMTAEVNRYRLAARGNPDHSYEFLLRALQRHVQLYRQDKNREDFLKGLQGAAGGQQRALPAELESEAFAAQAGKGKKPCWQFQKGSCARSNCPFAHVKSGSASEGKGKTTGTAPVCRFFAQTGKCQYGEKCRFKHAPRENLNGLVADEASGVEGSAFAARAERNPTPPPVESSACRLPAHHHVQSTHVSEHSRCGVRGEDESDICFVGTSVAFSVDQGACDIKDRKWIVDSGAGVDLISRSQLRESEIQSMCRCHKPKKLRTANGVVCAEDVVSCHLKGMCQDVTALVLEKCPPVLSLGRRIAAGYRFEWSSKDGAQLTTPVGKVVQLEVENHVPILNEGLLECQQEYVENTCEACPGSEQVDKEEGDEVVDDDCDDDHDVTPEHEMGNSRKRYMQQGRCKDAVGSRVHELTHFPKNRFCRVCREVMKVSTPARRITPGEETLRAESFGKVIHLDHVFSGTECHGVNGESCALVILDQHSGFIGAYPMSERTGPNVVSAIRHFLGDGVNLAEVKVRADNAKEYEFATKSLGLAWYKSTPHRHQSNGKIERCIRSVCEMTRCTLAQSGLQKGHWPYAMEHAAMMRNLLVPYHTHGKTPWIARFGEEFQWEIWPFGASMRALIKGNEKQEKFEPNSKAAIFIGYEFAPGCAHADYRVATLHSGSGDGYDPGVINIRRTVDIIVGGQVTYPAMEGLEGIRDCVIRHVPAAEADDRTLHMLHEGIVDESGVLTEAQRDRGWTVHRFGERLVKTPPRSSRPPDWTPEDWRSLPMNVRKAFAELYKEKLDRENAASSVGAVCLNRKRVKFGEGNIGTIQKVSILKAAARWRGPQNDANCMGKRINAAYANTLLNVRLVTAALSLRDCVADENNHMESRSCENSERSLETVLDELEALLEERLIPTAPQRTNVAREGDTIRSMLLGAYTRRGRGVTGACLKKKWWPVLQLVHEAAKLRGARRKGMPYAAIQINQTSVHGMISHVDQNNVGISDVISLGKYQGGELSVNGVELTCHRKWAELDGSQAHEVAEVQGRRWSIILHTPRGIEKLNQKSRKRLSELGFPIEGQGEVHDQGGNRKFGLEANVVPAEEIALDDHVDTQTSSQESAAHVIDEGDHREHDDCSGIGWGAFITRQIWPNEAEFHSEGCQKALKAELSKLVQKETWDTSSVQELSEVRAGKFGTAAIGRVYAIMGEKHSEVQDPSLKEYKARIVFQGNNIRMTNDVSASEVFRDVSNTPANMSIARTAIGAGLSTGMEVSLRDVSQAYLQSFIHEEGEPETWVVLPRSWWPPEWYGPGGEDRYQSPCCKLSKALYGHPVSGRRWEQRLSECLGELGWRKSEENPGTWIKRVGEKDARHACLVTYVDDLLLVGPSAFSESFWRSLEKKLEFKEEEAPLYRYLGANHVIEGGTMKVEMCGYAQKAIDRFEIELGRKLRTAATPYISDGAEKEALDEDGCGDHAKTASSHIATLLFLARMSRPDLMTAVMKLPRWVSKWEHVHDLLLVRLFEYLKGTVQTCLVSHVERNAPVEFIIWTDADLNGDPTDSKSTSGLWIEMKSVGSEQTWPITWNSKRQGGSAYATCESEIIALNNGVRDEGIPLHGLVEAIVGSGVRMVCREDNTQAISAIQRGYSKKLRHLPRIHRISIGALNEMLCGSQRVGDLEYHETSSHRADVFTKPLERVKFQRACSLLGLRFNDCSREGGVKRTADSAC
eukprot:6478544-Amphidinium_carterae.1